MADNNPISPQGGQIAIRLPGETSCIHHHGKTLDFVCDWCKDIICVTCTTTIHNKHRFSKLSTHTQKKKKKLRTSTYKTETSLIQVTKTVKSIASHIKESDRDFEAVTRDVRKQSEKLKRKIDVLTEQTLTAYKQLKEENAKLMSSYKEEVENIQKDLSNHLQECKKILETGTVHEIYDFDDPIDVSVKLPDIPKLEIASFSPNTTPQEFLKKAFGTVNKGNTESNDSVKKSNGSSEQERPVSSNNTESNDSVKKSNGSTEQNQSEPSNVVTDDTNKRSNSTKGPPQESIDVSNASTRRRSTRISSYSESTLSQINKLASTPTLREHPRRATRSSGKRPQSQEPNLERPLHATNEEPTEHPVRITVLAIMLNGESWILEIDRRTVVRISARGIVLQEIRPRRDMTKTCFSDLTQQVWFCSADDNSVVELTGDAHTPKFYIEETPLCMTITRDNHIIIGMFRQITKYTTEGDIVLTTKPSILALFSRRPVCVPDGITECPLTKNIAVLDRSAMNVLVMNKDFVELFRYKGNVPKTIPDPIWTMISPHSFNPIGVWYEQSGYLMIHDVHNECLHHVSGNGESYDVYKVICQFR